MLCAVLSLLGQPLPAAAALILIVALALPTVSGGVLANVPAATVLVLAGALVVTEAAAVAGLDLTGSTGACRALLTGSAVAVAGTATLLRRDRTGPRRPDFETVCVAVPAAVLVAVGLALALRPASQQVQWFFEGDNPRHLIFAAQTWADGNLDYSAEPYPRGWHGALALLWGAGGAEAQAPGLLSLLELMTSAMWGLAAVLALATGLLTRALGGRCAVTAPWNGLMPLLAGAVLLTPPFLGNYLALGFQNSLVAALVLATALLELLSATGRARSLVVTAAGVAVIANAWQLLLPAALVALALAAVLCLHPSRSGRRHQNAGARAVVLAVAGSALVALPGGLAVLVQTGLEHGVNAGVEAPFPLIWVLLGLAAAGAIALLQGRDLALLAVPFLLGVTAVTGLALAAVLGISPTLYYPSKTFWHVAALGIPGVFALAGWGLSRLWRVSRPGLPLTAMAAVAVAVAALLLTTPFGAMRGDWSTVRADRVLAAVAAPGGDAAQVVWTGDREDDTIARILLDFYRVPRTLERTVQHPATVAEECALLEAAAVPAVVTDRPPQDVRERYRCVEGLRIVGLAGS